MFFLVLFSAMIVGDLSWWWWADRRLRHLPRPRVWRGLLALYVLTLAGLLLAFLISPTTMRRAHSFLPTPLHAMVYAWHLVILPLTIIVLLLTRIGRGIRRVVRGPASEAVADRGPKDPAWSDTPDGVEEPVDSETPLRRVLRTRVPSAPTSLSRRQFLGATGAIIPPLLSGGMVGFGLSVIDDFHVKQRDVLIPNLPPDLDGLRICHLTDVHVGKFTRDGSLARAAALANKRPDGQRPHLTLLTGDLIDLSISDLPAALDFVRSLDPLHHLAMCEGNHDLIDSPARFYRDVRAAGIPLLIDEANLHFLPGMSTPVQLMGMRWGRPSGNPRGGGESQIPEAMASLSSQRIPGAFPILLAHHPHAFDAAADASIPLTLAGHTHGGQLQIGRFSPAGLLYRYWSGLYRKGNCHCYVSNGVGNWFPFRCGAWAEITHLTLQRM